MRGTGDGTDKSSRDELESLRAAKRQMEIKLQLLKKRYEEELTTFNEARVENIFKNSGAREYLERLKDQTKIKDGIIKNLKEDLEFRTKEIAELHARCKEAEKQSQEYLKAWREAQMARAEAEKMTNLRERSQAKSINMSSASSFIEHSSVPPPPPVEAPSIEELLTPCASDSRTALSSSIPPPPEVEVPMDEILKASGDRRAFEQEKGQFMCSVYLSIDSSNDTLSDIVELIEAEQTRYPSEAFRGWISLNNQTDAFEKSDFHVTLIRGHRTIHYHQIKPLLAAIEDLARSLKKLNLCLDKLRLFSNYEQTKQFLAITTRNNQSSVELSDFMAMKRSLRDVADQFADRSTVEDETEDTIPHCSIMSRELIRAPSEDEVSSHLREIESLCNENLDDYICLVNIDKIKLKIGKEVYSFDI